MASKVVVSAIAPGVDFVVSELLEAGCEVVQTPMPKPPEHIRFTPDQINNYFRDADVFLSGPYDDYTGDVLRGAPRLRLACSSVIGTDNIDVETATELGILVGHGAVPSNFEGVAEAIVILAGALLKELPAKQSVVREKGWRPPYAGRMVANRTIGMIGFGRIGRSTARRLAGWGVRLLATDPYVAREAAAEYSVELVDLDTLLRWSDVVSIQVTLTSETRHLIGERELSLMKPDAFLINTSRGEAVDEEALVRALDDKRISGAAIDVWRQEPSPVDHPLRTHPRVIATGHNIGHSVEGHRDLAVAAVENVLRGLRGEEPLYVKNPEVIPAWRERLARLGVAG